MGKKFMINESSSCSVRVGNVRLNGGQVYDYEAMQGQIPEKTLESMSKCGGFKWVDNKKSVEQPNPEPKPLVTKIFEEVNEKAEVKKTDITNMSKDELEKYAKEKYGVDLDKRKGTGKLVKEVDTLGG